MSYGDEVPFNASSSLFQCAEGGLFTRENLGLRVSQLYKGDHPKDIPLNLERTRSMAFDEIRRRYNRRIWEYSLIFDELRAEDESKLEIHSVKCGDSMAKDIVCGRFSVFPRTFTCKSCGDFILLSEREMHSFDPNKCQAPGCSGTYGQVSVVKFCETCGLIDQLFYKCRKNASHRVQLHRPIEDEPGTWKFRCTQCGSTLDFLAFQCNHSPWVGANPVTSKNPSKFRPITVQEGGVFSPQVMSILQVPSLRLPEGVSVSATEEQYVLLGLIFDCFSELFEEKGLGSPSIGSISDIVAHYQNESAKRMFLNRERLTSEDPEVQDQRWRDETGWEEIKRILEELQKDYPADKTFTMLEYAALVDEFGMSGYRTSFEDMLRGSREPDPSQKLEVWDEVKKRHKLTTITYVSRITISNVLLGNINGFVKPWKENFVPHFEPLWEDLNTREKLKAYLYSYETEGMVFEFDDEKIVEWLGDNGISIAEEGTPREMIANLDPESEAYLNVETLLHTIAHTLITSSEIFTGLSRDSLSEMIFPSAGAIFLYSTNQVNVGSFKYVFEHNMLNWLQQVEIEMTDCTFDPACIESRGACFSCLYLPEFVCSKFNMQLNRGALVGGTVFAKGFW